MPEPVRITHTFHPQCGQALDVVTRRSHWGEDRVFYRCARGHMASLPARWTSLVPEDPGLGVGEQAPRLRVVDLLELAAVVSELRPRKAPERVK